MNKFYLFLIGGLCMSLALSAQVTVTAPPPLTVSGCSFPTTYSSLGDITITENLITDISGSGDFILTAPANFEFQAGAGSVTTTGGDLTVSGLTVTATTITFSITVNSITNIDQIIISGIQVRGINVVSGPSDILRTGGVAIVLGDESIDGIGHGSLTSILNPAPTAFTVTGTGNYCSGGPGLPVGLSGSETGVNYQLKRGATNVGAPVAGTGAAISFGNQTTAGTYTVVATSAAGCTLTMTGNAIIGINTPVVASAGPAWSLCVGSATIGGSPAASGGTAPYTYSWTSAPVGFTSTVANPVVSPAATTTYSLVVTDNIGCNSAPSSVVVTVGAGPKAWVGTGAPAATGPDNNFNNALNWNPRGVPAACNDVTINLVGSVTIPINSNVTINSLTFAGLAGTDILNVQGNTLTINNNTSVVATAGTLQIGVNDAVSAGVIDFSGNVSMGPGFGITTFIGNTNSRLIFRKNLTMGNLSSVATGGAVPGSAEFLGIGNQVLTWSALTGTSRFKNVIIGDVNHNPIVTLTGSKVDNILGDLTINGSSTLDLGTNQWNRNAAGGSLTMNGTSTLRLAGASSAQTGIPFVTIGGVVVAGSNYPGGFGNTLSSTSTVEYYGLVAQTIYNTPVYGNLTVTNNSIKTAGGPLTVASNLLINPLATFKANGATGWTHSIGGNWTNNGTFTFAAGTTNVINFNGNNNATISGVSATGFHTMTVNKGASIATTLDLTSVASVTNALNFTNGLLRIQPTGSMTVNGSGPSILATSGLHVNGGTFTTNGVSVANAGLFRISSGTANIGTIAGNTLDNNNGSVFDMTGGTLNSAGRLTFSTGPVAISNLSGGTINLATVGNNSGTGSLDMTGASKINVSGGLVTFKNANTGAGGDVDILLTTGPKPFTGGTFQFGTATTPAAQVFEINSQVPLYNITVNNANNPVARLTNDILGSNDITINTGGTLDPATNNKNISLAGNWTNNGIFNSGAFPAQTTLVTFNGGAPQTISGTQKTTFNNLTLSNSSGLALLQNVDLLNVFSFGTSNAILTTNDFFTIKSGATNTGRVADITNNGLNSGNDITGNVTVERYIPARRAWRFLSVPTQPSQMIHAAWQENQPTGALTPAGLGTQITSNRATWLADGFDMSSIGGPSVKTYNPVTDSYAGIATTNAAFDPTQGGYMTFIRGDRTVNAVASPPTQTVLRTQGLLYTGTQAPLDVIAGQITPYNNPYASPLDLTKIAQSLSVFFYVWDPNAGGGSGFGTFQTLAWNPGTGNYDVIPGGGSFGPGNIDNSIESGQAFLVSGNPISLPLTEDKKGSGSNIMVFLPNLLPSPQLRTNLYGVNTDGTTVLADGTLSVFDNNYSSAMGAKKLANFGENLSIKFQNTLLAVERRRPVTSTDTIFFNLSGVSARQYHLEFIAENLDQQGMAAFLEDTYAHTKTSIDLNSTTNFSFTVDNAPGSHAPDRFRIVFVPTIALPVTFTSVKAYRVADNINVEWRVENENHMKQYYVEKSVNGTLFTTLALVPASRNNGGSASYISPDNSPVKGYNYYRITSEDINGKTASTTVVKVFMGSLKQDITVYPNPVTNGIVRMQFNNQPTGLYVVRLLNKAGQVIVSEQINHDTNNSSESISWNYNLAHGVYQLNIIRPDGTKKDINVIY